MLAFHNDPKIKAKYLRRVRQHAKLDQIVKGRYWQDGKGCAVGCTIHSAEHASYEIELGVPRALAYLEDRIFESLPNKHAMKWPVRFLSAVKPGVNLERVADKFTLWLLIDEKDGVLRFASAAGRAIIETVAELYRRKIAGEQVSAQEWNKAAAAAAAARWAAAPEAATAAAAWVRMADKLLELIATAPHAEQPHRMQIAAAPRGERA